MVGAPRPPAESAPAHYRPGPDDILLVAYPGSGLEILRKILAETLFGFSGNTPGDLDFFIPDLQIIAPWNRIVAGDFHFVKSHSPYFATDRILNGFKKVIYLRRDPSEALASQFRFLQQAGRYSQNADRFLADSLTGQIWPGHWAQHFQSWMGGMGFESSKKFLLLEFESLNRNPVAELRKLFSFCEIAIDDEKIQSALSRCAKDSESGNWIQRAQGVELQLASQWREEIESSIASQLTLLADPRILLPSSQGATHVRDPH